MEFGNIVPGVFTPVLAKHTKSFNLVDTLSNAVTSVAALSGHPKILLADVETITLGRQVLCLRNT